MIFFELFSAISFAVVSVLPIKWAADFCEAKNNSFLFCFLASFVAPILAILVFRVSGGGFNGFVLAYLALLGTYVAILRVRAGFILGFAIVALALQLATVMAVISFGYRLGS